MRKGPINQSRAPGYISRKREGAKLVAAMKEIMGTDRVFDQPKYCECCGQIITPIAEDKKLLGDIDNVNNRS